MAEEAAHSMLYHSVGPGSWYGKSLCREIS
jgi:hypothetical protein